MDLVRFPLEAETEGVLMSRLSEECAEVVQAVSKIVRFGHDGRYPTGETNTEYLAAEVADVEAVIAEVRRRGLIPAATWETLAQVSGEHGEGTARASTSIASVTTGTP